MTDIALADEALKALGVPISGVRLAGGVLSADYLPEATPEQRAAGDALLAGWDPAAREADARRRRTRAALTGGEPTQAAARNALRVIYASIGETRQRLNQLIAATGAAVPPLPIRTWAQALAAVRQQIDAETDPEA